jgi:hypothetical protein
MAQFFDSESRMMFSSKMILLTVTLVLALTGVAHGDEQHRDSVARAAARAAWGKNRAVTEGRNYFFPVKISSD